MHDKKIFRGHFIMAMKTLDRYIFNELLKVFLISAGGITLLLYLDKFLLMTEMLVSQGVSLFDLIRLVLYLSPAYLAVTVPMSVLVAVVVVCNQFAASNEWTAMKAAQWSFLRLLQPVALFSCVAYLIANAIIFYALPWGNQSYKALIFDHIQNRHHFEIQPNVFNTHFDNLTLLVGEKKEASHFKKIFIKNSMTPGVSQVISAQEGIFKRVPDSPVIHLQLKHGTIHEAHVTQGNYQTVNFDGYDLTLTLPRPLQLDKKAFVGNRELSPRELVRKIEEFKEKGLKYSGPAVELSKKFSIPFACLVFGLLGIPLGLQFKSAGKSGSFAVSFGVILAYYFCLITTQDLGRLGILNPYLSVWIANAILLVFGIYLGLKLQKEIPFAPLEELYRLAARLGSVFEQLFPAGNKIRKTGSNLRYNGDSHITTTGLKAVATRSKQC